MNYKFKIGEEKANCIFDVEFHWEGKWNSVLKRLAEKCFMEIYDEYTGVFNEQIPKFNAAFDESHPPYKTLEEAGLYEEYNLFVKNWMEPYIRELNTVGLVSKIPFEMLTIEMDDECQFRLVCPNGAYVYITMEFVRWLK